MSRKLSVKKIPYDVNVNILFKHKMSIMLFIEAQLCVVKDKTISPASLFTSVKFYVDYN